MRQKRTVLRKKEDSHDRVAADIIKVQIALIRTEQARLEEKIMRINCNRHDCGNKGRHCCSTGCPKKTCALCKML